MAVQRFEIDVDPNFEIHTSYRNDFFLLRTRVLVNGENTEIRSVREGKYEGPVLNFRHSGTTVSTKLRLIASTVSSILVQYGVYHVDTFYYEQSPLFHVVFSSESCLKNFILATEEVKSALEPKLQFLLLGESVMEAESPQQLTVEIQPDLFLISPNRQETKGAELHLVTAENCSDILARWRDSKLFDFISLYQEDTKPPKVTSQPTSQNNVLPGKAVAFSVQVIGTQPLNYQWQWKPAGEGDARDEWQDLSSGGSLRGVDTPTLTYSNVQSCREGLYRCVIANCAEKIASNCAELTVVKTAELVDLFGELEGVTEWLYLGLCLGVRLPRLMDIKADNQLTTKDRREQVLIEWQKQVTPLTWSAVVKALVGIRREGLAAHLASKYGVPLPDTVDNAPLEILEIAARIQNEAAGPELGTELSHHRGDLGQLGQKLTKVEKLFKSSRDSQVSLNESVDDIRSKLSKLGEEYEKAAIDRDNTERKLQHNERDCVLLSEMQKVHNEEKCQLLQEMIDDKRREIVRLRKDLQQKEQDLESVREEAKALQEQLSKVQEELSTKHKEVKQLQQEKKELINKYNLEKERMQTKVTFLTADREDMMQQLITTKVESEFTSQRIEACTSNISHLNKEIEMLSTSLREKEAEVGWLQNELQQAASTPTELSEVLQLTTQIASLQQKLQEMEYQKQQAELEKETAVQDVEARERFEVKLHAELDEPPKVTSHPESVAEVCPGSTVTFAVQATGTEPLSYRWQWRPVEVLEGGSEEWQPCPAEWCNGATLTIPSVQKSNEGSYCCVVSNFAGTQTSTAEITVADPPTITTQPQELKYIVPGKPVMFTAKGTGTEPLRYHWEWNPAGEGNEWQPCGLEGVSGADSSTVTISSVQKANEGRYHCVVSNCAGSQTSKPAKLGVADPPRVITHPQELENIVAGQPAMFSVEASGNEPLSYKWEWRPAECEEWQPCDAKGSNGATLTIPSVQKSNEGSFRCVINNYAGTQISNPAELSIADPPRVTTQPQDLKDAVPGNAVMFTVKVTGTEPLRYRWEWKPAGMENEWQPCDEVEFSGSDRFTLTIPNVRKFNEGSYRCVISNCAGSHTSNPAQLSVADPPRVTTHPQDLKNVVPGQPAMFSVEVSGNEPLIYKWEWKPAGYDEWQLCDAQGSNTATLIISSAQKSNHEGIYHCVISNCAGSQISKPAQLCVADPPKVTLHPRELKNVVPGQPVLFTVQATGITPLSYKWEWKPAVSEEWQPCDAQGSNSTTLTIPSVQNSNEGSYHCIIRNYAGGQTSNPANLSIAKPPSIITNPQDLIATQERAARFTIRAIGTEPLSYKWQWKPAKKWWKWGGSEEWKPCDAEWCDGATLTIPKVRKSNEGSYRCVISNCAGYETSKPANLKLSLQLRWRRCRDMQYGMYYPHCVVLERSVYVGGGTTDYDDDNAYIIQVYNLDTDNWSRLPRYQYMRFAISIINSRLTLVGGDDRGKPTNQLAVYEPSSQHWTYPYHPMPTPRYRPAVLMYDIWLLVAGGCDVGHRELATVELFNTSTHQWLAAASLPTPCSWLTSATINNNAYVVTDSKQVYRVSFPDIVSQTVDQSTASKSPALWCRLPDTPLYRCTAISLRGYLITVGGCDDNGRTRTDIHLYQPKSEQWTKVGDLPNVRKVCSCVVLPSSELLVAGGEDTYFGSLLGCTSRVDVASVLN